MRNTYSARWRQHFGSPDQGRTDADVAFLQGALPLPSFRRVLDVPCGSGRHRKRLTALGYRVVGVDVDPAVAPDVVGDLRELDALADDFDAVISMWASFGYFAADENERVLASLARRIRPSGRIVLDVHNREFFAGRDGERVLRPGVVERSRLVGDRRICELAWEDGTVEVFDWQLYISAELVALAAAQGLAPIVVDAAPDVPSMRLVFERG